MKTETIIKHTPGPWNIAPELLDQVYSVPEFERARREATDANPYDEALICETAGNEANARLIATAPELYNTLQSTRDALVMALDEYEAAKMKHRSAYLADAIAAIDAMLSKAEGRL